MTNEQLTVDLETADLIRDSGAETCTMCFQCAQCSSNCPWNRVAHLDPRRMLHKARLGVADLEDEEWWMCATCRTCVARCPMEVDIIGVMRAVRRLVVGYGAGRYPDSIRFALKSIAGAGNPAGESQDKRADWSNKANVPAFTPDMEVAYFSCCVPAYDAKVRRMATNLSGVLRKAGVKFGTLGTAEKCCGESVRKCGNEELFTNLATSNIEAFKQAGVAHEVALKNAEDVTFLRRALEAEKQIRGGQVEKVQGVALQDLAVMHQATDFFCGGGQLFTADDSVHGFGGGEVVDQAAEVASPGPSAEEPQEALSPELQSAMDNANELNEQELLEQWPLYELECVNRGFGWVAYKGDVPYTFPEVKND